MNIDQQIVLATDIYDDGESHHPPSYLAKKDECVIIRTLYGGGILGVSHENIKDNEFVIYPGEYIIN